VLAYDYPLLGLMWTMLMVFLWVAWIILLIRIFGDIFRSDDMGGWAKALWSLLVLFLPFLGVFVYLIARGGGMVERDMKAAQASEAAFQDYVRQTASSSTSTADELVKLAELRDSGVLTAEEFEAQKASLLA
jgi:hypothetical protein